MVIIKLEGWYTIKLKLQQVSGLFFFCYCLFKLSMEILSEF